MTSIEHEVRRLLAGEPEPLSERLFRAAGPRLVKSHGGSTAEVAEALLQRLEWLCVERADKDHYNAEALRLLGVAILAMLRECRDHGVGAEAHAILRAVG